MADNPVPNAKARLPGMSPKPNPHLDIPGTQMRHDLRGKGTLAESGFRDVHALQVARVTRVDSRRLTVDLVTLTGNLDTYKNVAISFGGAGSRHFIGAIPEVGDLCAIGLVAAESGATGKAYITGWIIPGPSPAFDNTPTQAASPADLGFTPAVSQALSGAIRRTRNKLSLLEEGNVFVSSSQGADVRLDESLLLSNRRGNEILLRDQDQAIVVRSLQQFHAGAGFRIYAGMVQRDSELPTQMIGATQDWASPQQVDGEDQPLPRGSLPSGGVAGYLTPAGVFARGAGGEPRTGLSIPSTINPYAVLARGVLHISLREKRQHPSFPRSCLWGEIHIQGSL